MFSKGAWSNEKAWDFKTHKGSTFSSTMSVMHDLQRDAGGPKKYALPIIKVGIMNTQRLCCSQTK